MYFFDIFCCFLFKYLRFYHFHFFFWQSIKFEQQNINQSETGIDDKKLSMELYGEERWHYVYRKIGMW